jgi:hypothetical protein
MSSLVVDVITTEHNTSMILVVVLTTTFIVDKTGQLTLEVELTFAWMV